MNRAVRVAVLLAAFALAAVAPSGAAGPSLGFTTFVHTDLKLGQVLWTGHEFLYVSENTGVIEAADARGLGARPWATFEPGGEETRCVPAPARYWPEGIYCHTPDNRILRFARDGTGMTVLARLPGAVSDGALAFDTVGRFGYPLLAATGGSGSDGGEVYAVRRDGQARLVGHYPGPGGADEVAIAPATFGTAGGALLLAIDQSAVSGRLLAVDRRGAVRVVAAALGNGANPIAVVAPTPKRRAAGSPAAGLYVADTASQDVLFAPAARFRAYPNAVVVGTELTGAFWIVRPRGKGFQVLAANTGLPSRAYNLEGAVYVP